MKTAVVTGATGVVGMALIDELMQQKWRVTVVVRPNSEKTASLKFKWKNIDIVELDISQLCQLPNMLNKEYNCFFHLGWMGTYAKERQDAELQNKNIGYTLDAVRAAAGIGCKIFVGVGSQAEYGHVEGKLTGDLYCHPDTAYGAAKLSAGHMSRVLCTQLGMRHEWCRILSVFGSYDREQTLIMEAVKSFLHGEKFSCTEGDQVWDYLYSKDAAYALRLIAEKGQDGRTYCLGSGDARSLREYICSIRNCINAGLDIGFGDVPYYPNQVMHLEADISQLENDTGYHPRYSFEDGMRELIAWYKRVNNI